MILSDSKILEEIANGNIVISPFERSQLGSNSYDVRLGKWLRVYDESQMSYTLDSPYIEGEHRIPKIIPYIDAKKDNPTIDIEIPEEGFILMPNMFYLGATLEYTETHNCVPFLEGKSSTGRLSVNIHATAGKGDVGFCGHWTLEISCQVPVKIYPNMPIGQLIYFPVLGDVINSYNKKPDAKYSNQGSMPVGSQMFKNFKK